MMKRMKGILTVTVILTATFWAGTFEGNSKTVNAAEPIGAQGRYQLAESRFEWTDKTGAGVPTFAPFLVDTVTGRVWLYSGPDAQVMSSPVAAAAGIGGFDQVQFNGAFTREKNGKLTPHASYLPQ
ncbi:MAG TPA: hypothetical protein VMV59_12110 [Candidatus Dormibacteraeota bacterium]|nr:hypothetical protein [Candidatus Dormibacteraeota bacterium]